MRTAQPLIAKVFKSGNSQAIRMPSSIKLKSKTYLFEDQGDCILLIDPSHEAKRLKNPGHLR